MHHDYFMPLHQRTLLWQFARRDVLARYRGSLLGLGWSFLTPLLMLAVYTFVFRGVFNARWGTGEGGGFEFALQLYTGLIVFNLVSDCLSRAPRLIVDQPNLVKKVVFPLELMGWVALFSALFHWAANTLVLLLAAGFIQGLHPSMLALPLVMLPLLPGLLGLMWFLASLGVFVRDVGQIIGMLMNLLMFLSPVFYPASALPESWQFLLRLNPLTLIIEESRLVVSAGQWPHWEALMLYGLFSLGVGWLGHRWFKLTRKGFADVL